MSMNGYARSRGQKRIAVFLTIVMALTIYSGYGLLKADKVYANTAKATWVSDTSGKGRISMTEEQTITVAFDIDAANKSAALAALEKGEFFLYRDKGAMHDVLDHKGQKVYPYEFIARGEGRGRLPEAAGKTPWKLSDWVQLTTSGGVSTTKLFKDFNSSARSNGDGTFEIKYTFSAGRLFNTAAANNMREAFLDATGNYKLEFCSGKEYKAEDVLASATVNFRAYDSYRTMPEIYKEINAIEKEINENTNYWAEVRNMGKSTGKRDMPYIVIAKDSNVVSKWQSLMERAETEPQAVLNELKTDKLKDYQVPILYSNIHANEFNGVDSILNFTHDLIDKKSITYDVIDNKNVFTAEGKTQYETEQDSRKAKTPEVYDELDADRQPTGLGYITGDTSSDTSRKVDLEKYYNMKKETVKVDELLDDVFFIIVPEENVDGRTLSAREGYGGIDLNRDNLFQTQAETQNMTKMIASWNPIIFWEQHGFVSNFQVEPCTPPHEANFEYDLLAQNLTGAGEAYGNAAISNNDKYNSFKMPMRDYFYPSKGGWDVWDDVSTAYTPEYAMLHGTVSYTVEVPTANESANTALQYGLLGNAKYTADNKDDLFKNQVTGYLRGTKNIDADTNDPWYEDIKGNVGAESDVFRPKYSENDNYFPEYYVIPMDKDDQRNTKAAEEMQQWLLDSDVKLSKLTADTSFVDSDGKSQKAKAGSVVVDMHQAKRNVANVALGKGLTLKDWGTTLYSEPITAFSETRGYSQHVVTTENAFSGKLAACESVQKAETETADTENTVILNSGVEAVKAVNMLLDKNVKVGWITEGDYKGHFYVRTSDYNKIKNDVTITVKDTEPIKTVQIIKKPKVYVTGAPTDEFAGSEGSKYGAREKPRLASSYYDYSYNYKALATEMGFDVITEHPEKADIIVGHNPLYAGSSLNNLGKEVLSGTPYVGWGGSAVNSAKLMLGSDYMNVGTITNTTEGRNIDALYPAKMSKDSLITAHKDYYKDDVMYNYGCGYMTSVPSGVEILSKVDGDKILAGSMEQSRYAGFADSIQGIAYEGKYKGNDVNMTVFSHALTRKNHQKDDYTIISSAIFNAMADSKTTAKSAYVDVTPTASGITLGEPLSKSKLTGGVVLDSAFNEIEGTFTWVKPSEVPNAVGVYSAKAIFVPEDDSYKSIKLDVDVAVSEKKATSIESGQVDPIPAQTATGKGLQPKVRFMLTNDAGKKVILEEGTDYVVTYKDNVDVGIAKVIIIGAGEYEGEFTGTFKIKAKTSAISKITVGKGKMKVTWKKVPGISNYQVAYKATSGKTWKYKTVSAKSTSTTISKLTKGKKYHVKVRSYNKQDGTTYYSSWSSTKTSEKIKK